LTTEGAQESASLLEQQADARLLRLRREVHRHPRRLGGELRVGVLPAVVDDGRVLGLLLRVGEQGF
jgi:hypothetical protein